MELGGFRYSNLFKHSCQLSHYSIVLQFNIFLVSFPLFSKVSLKYSSDQTLGIQLVFSVLHPQGWTTREFLLTTLTGALACQGILEQSYSITRSFQWCCRGRGLKEHCFSFTLIVFFFFLFFFFVQFTCYLLFLLTLCFHWWVISILLCILLFLI